MAGHEIAVCDEGVEELKRLSRVITENLEELLSAKNAIQAVADEYNDALGAPIISIYELLDEIVRITKNVEEPCEVVSEKLIKTAKKYQDLINHVPPPFR